MDYGVEYLFVFMFGMILMGVLLNAFMFFNEDEITGMFGGRFVRVDAEQEDVESSWERSRASFDCMEDCLFCSTEEFDSAYDGCEEFCSVWVYKLENSYTWRRC